MFDIKVLLLINNYYLIRFLKNKYISYKYKHILTYSYYYFIISININYIGGDNIVFNECVISIYLICILQLLEGNAVKQSTRSFYQLGIVNLFIVIFWPGFHLLDDNPDSGATVALLLENISAKLVLCSACQMYFAIKATSDQ